MKGIQSNGFLPIIAQAIAEMEAQHGEFSSIDEINLAELGRRTGLSRAKLRRLKANGFCKTVHGLVGKKKEHILDGYSAVLDRLLRDGVSNSAVCLERLQEIGFTGSCSTVKRYIAAHKHLIPAKRQQVAPQGNRGRRYITASGEAYQMDWGFTDVLDYNGNTYRAACFAMLHQKVNPKTIKNVHGVLHSALSQAVQCGLLRSNPADHAVLPRRSRAEIHVLEAERITEFLRAIEGHRYQYLYLLDLLTGMRQSELLGLQWEDIDWEKGSITVKRQLQFLGGKEGYRYTTPKSNKPRIIVLPDAAIRALEKQQALQDQSAEFFQEGWSNPEHLVFTDELGGHIKHDVVYRNLKRIFAAMGLPDLRFHDLR